MIRQNFFDFKTPALIGIPFVILVFADCGGSTHLNKSGGSPIFLADTMKFAVIGDFGYAGENEFAVSEMVKSWDPDFIITTGDNNYTCGLQSTLHENIGQYYCDFIYNYDAPEELRCKGKAFEEKINRFFPTLGNHDYDPEHNNDPYLAYFSLPGNEKVYDFTWGPVHLFTVNSMEYLRPLSLARQKKWLKKKLEKSASAFKIVYFHHAPYSTGLHGNTEFMQWNFMDWGATAVISGHDHFYSRVHKKDEGRFPYFVNGAGGHSIRTCNEVPLDPEQFEVLCYDKDYGAMLITATTDKMIIEFYSIGNQDSPFDRYVIPRKEIH